MKIDVLDKGHIELVDTLGDDLTRKCRVSFGGRSDEFTTKDKRLSKFLIKHKHFSPFRHQHIMVIVRRLNLYLDSGTRCCGYRNHIIKCHKRPILNEISGRYIRVQEYYHPSVWRKQSEDNKQK